MKPKIILATTNDTKINPFMYSWNQKGLSDFYEILTFKDIAKPDFEVEEDTGSFEKDALKKAIEYSKHFGLPAISLDRGIEIPSLENWPGTKSKDVFLGYSDETKGFVDPEKSVLENEFEISKYVLGKIQDKDRVVNSVYGIAIALPSGESTSDMVTFSGVASKELINMEGGWNYDWFYIPNNLKTTLSELSEAEYTEFTATYMWPVTEKIIKFMEEKCK